MLLPPVALLACSSVLALACWRRSGGTPMTAGMLLWTVVSAVVVLNPLSLPPISGGVAWIISLGLIALAAPTLVRGRSELTPAGQGDRGVALARLVFASALVGIMVVVGVLAFRAGVASATGADYGSLSIEQVRAAQTGSARGGGLLSLLQAANPLLACLGVYGAIRYSRLWLGLVVVALVASLQTPARLTTLSLVVITAVFYAYARPAMPERRSGARRFQRPPVALMVLAGAVVLGLFNYLGNRLGKTSLVASYFPDFPWPAWSLSPIVYFTGGPAALTTALRSGVDPFEHPNSIFALARAWQVLDPTYKAPETLAEFVPIRIPFNVYTGFGQIYYDFGVVGVIALSALFGWLAVVAHRRARAGRLEWGWVSAVLASLLLSMPQAYRLFFLDTDFQLAVGFVAFWLVRRSRRRSGDVVGDAVVGTAREVAERPSRVAGEVVALRHDVVGRD